MDKWAIVEQAIVSKWAIIEPEIVGKWAIVEEPEIVEPEIVSKWEIVVENIETVSLNRKHKGENFERQQQ